MKHITIVLLIFVCLVTPAFAEDITWEELQTSANWTARSEHATCWFDDKYWVIGGYNATGYVNDVWYSTDGVGWFCANYSAEFSPRGGHAVLAPGDGYMYLIGGTNKTWTQTCNTTDNPVITQVSFHDVYKTSDGEVWELVTDTPGWYGTYGNLTFGRSFFGACVGNGSMWVTGGVGFTANGYPPGGCGGYDMCPYNHGVKYWDDVYYSTDGDTWTYLGDLPDHTGSYDEWAYHQSPWMSITLIGGKKSADGGYIWSESYPAAGTAYSSYDGITWSTRTTTAEWTPRSGHSAVYINSKLVLMGGYTSTSLYKHDVWYSSNEGETWAQYSDADWEIREYPQAIVNGDYIYIFGGYSSAGGYYNDVWRGEINTTATSDYETSDGGAGIQYPPHDVLFTIRDLSGSPVSGVTVTAQPTETTMGNWDWLKNLFGIDTEDVNIAGTNMTGTTGSDGTISFIMMEDIRYHITLYSETDSISETYDIYPKDEMYLFVVGTSDLPKPTTVAAKYISYDLDADYENNTYVNFTFEWMDESNGTTFVWWNVTNGTTTLETQNLTPSGGYTNESYAMLLGYTDSSYTYGFNAYHPTYGWTNQSKTLMDHKEVDIGLSGTWLNFGAFGLVALVGLMFSRKNWKVGMFVTCIFAIALTQMHILIINESYESTMFILGGLTFLSVIILIRGAGDKNV